MLPKRDYQHTPLRTQKQLRNPFFSRPRQGSRAWFFGSIILALVLIGLFYVVYGPLCSLTNIIVNGVDEKTKNSVKEVIEQQKMSWRWHIAPQKNNLFFDQAALGQKLRNLYPAAVIDIDRNLFHTITVTLQQAPTTLIWVTDKATYDLDQSGTVIRQTTPAEALAAAPTSSLAVVRVMSRTIPTVYDSSGAEPDSHAFITTTEMVDQIIALDKALEQAVPVGIVNYRLASRFVNDITALTTEGWELRLSLETAPDIQAEKIKLLLTERIKPADRARLEYIDSRFGDRIYWK